MRDHFLWRVIKVAVQTCSCKGQGGAQELFLKGDQFSSALRCYWLLDFLETRAAPQSTD